MPTLDQLDVNQIKRLTTLLEIALEGASVLTVAQYCCAIMARCDAIVSRAEGTPPDPAPGVGQC